MSPELVLGFIPLIMKQKTIVIFTQSFPYKEAAEHTFLQNEIKYLLEKFDKVIIVPEYVGGDIVEIDKNVVIDDSLYKFIKNNKTKSKIKRRINGINSNLIIKEFFNKPKIFFNRRKINCLISYIDRIKLIKKWILKRNYFSDNKKTIAYTYWFTATTSTLLDIKNKNYRVIARIHGTDLYEKRHNNYLPLRKYSIAKIDRIYCVSQAGKDYLSNRYNAYQKKYKLAKLGTKNHFDFGVKKKNDNIFRIVSCSSLIELKRVELILEGIIEFSKREKNSKIEWVHFGDGPLMKNIEKKSSKVGSKSIKIELKGNVENSEILSFYANSSINLFVTASSSEGVPVSIMEAQSFGIPVIATKVGGIPEIINEKNGILISNKPSPVEIADALQKIYNMDKNKYKNMQIKSKEVWEKYYNADVNFREFAEEISKL